MKFHPSIALFVLLCLVVSSCKQHQEARQPISHSSGSFMKKSVARNKKLVASEEDLIKTLIKNNPKTAYLSSSKGYWYAYQIKNTTDTLTPQRGDIAYYDYDIKDLKGSPIYTKLELQPQTYYVDKQEIMMGLRDGIKKMRKGEKICFLFPSHMAFGYHGDNQKIGTNQPLMVTVTLNNFVPEPTTSNTKTQLPKTTTTAVIAKKETTTPKKLNINPPKDTIK
ncbi:gliding motility-associated peptidyl-prolyl isomerase GldI [Flavobacterium crassostreae]|uniref:Peptidyl-prolyl cis-trans isomerase n=1 Tax=Flavobacterium crassostreae TaxID=1763534 RepID=A0A1B9E8Y9_9FLAO|nr:gliding motility-associated peptidyl-prolyl isomerase GldI [Flavobacterium crassostreae]OCB78427.1 gliding motility-associated peptidyl-prolyl isomerase GldI [Flavobacterium crassostreae]